MKYMRFLLLVLSFAVSITAFAQGKIYYGDSVLDKAPADTPQNERIRRDLERRFNRPKQIIVTSTAFDSIMPRTVTVLLDGANDLSQTIAKYRYGESVSFFGKARGTMMINNDLMITPPHRRNASFITQYGIVPIRSERLPGKIGVAIREKYTIKPIKYFWQRLDPFS